jgi:integrase
LYRGSLKHGGLRCPIVAPKEEKVARKNLTDRLIRSLKPNENGSRYEVMDSLVSGLGVRVSGKGKLTFVLVARFPPNPNPTRREIGRYGLVTLEEARARARTWIAAIHRGADPKIEEGEAQALVDTALKNTFGAAVDEYLRDSAIGPDEANPLKRSGPGIKRTLQVEFVNDQKLPDGTVRKGLRDLPIKAITPAHIIKVLDDVKARGSRGGARNYLGTVKAFFNWAIASGKYDLKVSPCDRMKPKALFGPKPKRTRLHSERELLALWRATFRLGYPYGPFFQFLLLCGKRKSEPAKAKWSEFDLKNREWIVPGSRTKNKMPHLVCLTDGMLRLLDSLPKHSGQESGPYVFSTTFGIKSINGFGKIKVRFDRFMKEEYSKILNEGSGRNISYEIEPYVIHDFRKDIRTNVSKLGVSREIGRLIIGHTIGGLDAVYDLYAYMNEKRDAL